jgi:hypothetical protein
MAARQNRIFRVAAVCLTATLSACANMQTIQGDPKDAGEARKFDAGFERVKAAALDGIRDMDIEPSNTEDTADGFVIYIARAPHGMSWGEVGRVIVDKAPAPPTTVHVDYRRRTVLQYEGSFSDFAGDLFKRMDASLHKSAAN